MRLDRPFMSRTVPMLSASRAPLAATIAAAAPFLLACSPENASAPADARPNVLVVALSDDPAHLNPVITTQGGVHTTSKLLYNGLVGLSRDLEPLPELATSWDVEDGGRRYRFHLREGVTWHDGEPFTAEDVRFTFEEVLLRYHARARASLGTVLDSIHVPDPLTIEFHFAEPYAPLLRQLHVHEGAILPRHLFEGEDPLTHPANQAPVGTGPFRFVSWTPGVEIEYEANPDYFKPGLPRLDRIVMRVIPDAGNQVLALEAGEVDWLFGAPGPELGRLDAEGFGLIRDPLGTGGENCIMTLSYNLDRPKLRDVRVRRAIALAIDRRQVLDRILFGQGRVATAPISSGIPYAHAEGLDLPGHDPERARALLEEAGALPLELEFLHFPTYRAYGQLLRAQLAAVGIDFVARSLEPPVFVDAVFTRRDFDMNIVSYCNSTDPEVGVRRMYVTSNIAPVPFSNSSAYRNSTVDSLFDAARSELDAAARARSYRALQEILVRELPYYWLVETTGTWVHAPRCAGFLPYGHWAEEATCGPGREAVDGLDDTR